eukprot:g14512.t1
MVSFSCDSCQATVKKTKVEGHSWSCGSTYFTCIDCSTTFDYNSFKEHNSCISEAQKYQGKLYRPNKKEQQKEKKKEGTQGAAAGGAQAERTVEKAQEAAAAGAQANGHKKPAKRKEETAPAAAAEQPKHKKRKSVSEGGDTATTATPVSAEGAAQAMRELLEQHSKDGVSYKALLRMLSKKVFPGLSKAQRKAQKDQLVAAVQAAMLLHAQHVTLRWFSPSSSSMPGNDIAVSLASAPQSITVLPVSRGFTLVFSFFHLFPSSFRQDAFELQKKIQQQQQNK